MRSNKKKMPQDDSREIRMRRLLKLESSDEGRGGTDAIDKNGNKYELKTSFKKSKAVSTARAMNNNHLVRWRGIHWVFAFGTNYHRGFELTTFYYLSPQDMEDWFRQIETKLNEFSRVSELVKMHVLRHINKQEYKTLVSILKNGSQLNDPTIPYTYITSHGTLLIDPIHKSLQKLMKNANPNIAPPTINVVTLEDYFL